MSRVFHSKYEENDIHAQREVYHISRGGSSVVQNTENDYLPRIDDEEYAAWYERITSYREHGQEFSDEEWEMYCDDCEAEAEQEQREKEVVEDIIERLIEEIEDNLIKQEQLRKQLSTLKESIRNIMAKSGYNQLEGYEWQYSLVEDLAIRVPRNNISTVYAFLESRRFDCREFSPGKRKLAIEVLLEENHGNLPSPLDSLLEVKKVQKLKISKI